MHESTDDDEEERDSEDVAVAWIASRLTADPGLVANILIRPQLLEVVRYGSFLETTPEISHHIEPMVEELRIVLTSSLPVAIIDRDETLEIWQVDLLWRHIAWPSVILMKTPLLVSSNEGTAESRIRNFADAIAIQRTAMARRSRACRWCGELMVKGERFDDNCCFGCASHHHGIVF